MKKQFLLLSLLVVNTFLFAQQAPSFGIKAGVSSSGMRGDASAGLENMLDFSNGMITTADRTGFFAGGYANIPVGDVISIEPGLYYSQKGMQLRGNLAMKGMEFLGVNARARLNAQYVDLPVLVKANISGLQLFAGPQVSYLANANLRTTAGVLGFNLLNVNTDASNQFNKWDAALTGGIGYQFGNGLNISAAYDHGLTRADANRNVSTFNRVVKVGIGMTF